MAARQADRLDSFYEELKYIYKKSFPYMRAWQFLLNALGWINSTKKMDLFFSEEDEMLEYITEYAEKYGYK